MLPVASFAASFERVYVGCLPHGTTEQALRGAFNAAGIQVRGIDMVMDRTTGLSRGFAFVLLGEWIDPDIDSLALVRLRTASLDGRLFDIRAVPPPNTDATRPGR